MTRSGTIVRDGFELEWVREGDGMPMLVVGTHRYYRRAFPAAMREHFDMVFCDSRQWVASPVGFDLARITSDTVPADIEAVRVAAGLDRPIVTGHSQHGALAFEYARRYADKIRGVLLVAAMPPFSAWEGVEPLDDFFRRAASPERLAAHEHNQATRRVADTVESSADFIDNYVADGAKNWFDYTFDARPLWDGVTVNLEVLYRLFAPEVLGAYEIEPLDVPVFLALGRYDYGIPTYVWDRPKSQLRLLTERVYEESAHTPQYEQPEAFVRDVLQWAAQLPA